MMTFFPNPYEDELLYSILGRYHVRSGNTSIKATLQDIFGSTTVTAVVDLPSNINSIIANMPVASQYTAADLVDKHTLYPFYSAFLTPEEAVEIKEYMIGDKGGSIYNKIGLMASSVSLNHYFKYCAACLKEDRDKYGEIYWHRVHQIPGVFVCPKHRIILEDSQVPLRGHNKHEYRIPSLINSNTTRNKSYSDTYLENMTEVAEDINYLLNNKLPYKLTGWFRQQYLGRLMELGFANINGRIKQKELLKEFLGFYSPELLILLQSDVNPDSSHNWLLDTLRRKNKSTHPLRHLLLMRFLGISIEDMFYRSLEYKPFGDKPWPCLNPVAVHYLDAVIDKIEIKYGYDSKNPIGIFKCDCGFTYIRTGPDKENSDRYKITKIKAFGSVWEEKLKELAAKKMSLRETARQMKADPITIKKYAKELGIKTYWLERSTEKSDDVEISEVKPQKDKRKSNRKRWLDLKEKHPEKSKTQLRQIEQGLYTWLYRNDREWLDNNSPDLKSSDYINIRIDWEDRDRKILQQVKKVVEDIVSEKGKPKRITVSFVGSRLGIRSLLEKHLDKMPKSKKYLEMVIQSKREYQLQRIKWAIEKLQEEEQEVKLWRVFRLAGIRKEYQESLSAEIINSIERDNKHFS